MHSKQKSRTKKKEIEISANDVKLISTYVFVYTKCVYISILYIYISILN